MATIDFILQGKGGVGKSMVASIILQAKKALGHEVLAVDTDPINATLSGYKEFSVKRLKLLASDGNIDSRKFDELLEFLAEVPEDAQVVVDNGASSFVALASYIKENDMLETLAELGHKVNFHTVITGGQALTDTLEGYVSLATNFLDTNLVVWLNPFFGTIELDGKKFTDFKCYKEHSHNIMAIIELPLGNKALIGKDLEELFMKKQSFEAGINSSASIAVRSRLKKYWKDVLSFVEQADIC